MDKQAISIDLNITRFTKDMYDNLISMISQDEVIDIYLYNYIAKKHTFVTNRANVHIFNYNGSKKKVALDIFQSLNTLSECLIKSYKKVYLLCGAVDREILINVLQSYGIEVILLVQENSSTTQCTQLLIDRVLPDEESLSLAKLAMPYTYPTEVTYNEYMSRLNQHVSCETTPTSKSSDTPAAKPSQNVNDTASPKRAEFLINTGITQSTHPKQLDAESKLRLLIEALSKSKTDSLRQEYQKLVRND